MAKIRKSVGSQGQKESGKAVAKRVKIQPLRQVPQSPPIPRGKKTTLSKKELGDFREMLLAKRRTLLGDLSGMAEQTTRNGDSGNLSTMPTHMADVGTDNFEHEFTLGLLESEQALLREINDALRRIDDRTYGICLGTGEPIPKARLIAKPWAKYTVDYARKLEKGLVRPPDADEGKHDDDDEEDAEAEAEPEESEEEVEEEADEEPEAEPEQEE